MLRRKKIKRSDLKRAQARLSRRASALRKKDKAADKDGPSIRALLEASPVEAEDALRYARELAEKEGARLYEAGIRSGYAYQLYKVAIAQGLAVGAEAARKQ